MSKTDVVIPLGDVSKEEETRLNEQVKEIINSMNQEQLEHFLLLANKINCSKNYLVGCILEDVEKNVPYREKYNVCQQGRLIAFKQNIRFSIGRVILWVFGVQDEFVKEYLMRNVSREEIKDYYYRFIKGVLKRQEYKHIPEYVLDYTSENTLTANRILIKNMNQFSDYMKSFQLT